MAENVSETPATKSKGLTEEDLNKIKTIYVKIAEFPDEFDEEKFTELFKDCGNVVSTTLLRNPTGQLRGYGFVQFETPAEARKAVETKNNMMVGQGRLGVVLSTSDGPKEKVHKEVGEGPTLFVRQLAWRVKQKQLKKAFNPFGEVKSVRVSKKGYGFVEFDSIESAKKAKEEMDGKELEGKTIAIDYALERPEQPQKNEATSEPTATPEKKSRKKRNRRKGNKGKKSDAKPEEKKEMIKQTDDKKPAREQRPRRKIFLKHLVEEGGTMVEVTDEDVKSYLAQYGEVVKTKIIRKPEGTFIYVTMQDGEGAAKAEAAGEGTIQGLTFSTKYAPPNRKKKGKRKGRGPKKPKEETAAPE